jgi:hypothetical protein
MVILLAKMEKKDEDRENERRVMKKKKHKP